MQQSNDPILNISKKKNKTKTNVNWSLPHEHECQ